MSKPTDMQIQATELYLLPVQTRVPLKFGSETLTQVTCARVKVTVKNQAGNQSHGWGETPLNVQWVWPSELTYGERLDALVHFCELLVDDWTQQHAQGHALEIGHLFIREHLPKMLEAYNATHRLEQEPLPHLAALVCLSAFDIATHDAFGNLVSLPVYETYNEKFLSNDLSKMISSADDADVDFQGQYLGDFLAKARSSQLAAWHLVGGLDLLTDDERAGNEPDDGYPVTLEQWIMRDGLTCLKVKLRGNDQVWDKQRLIDVGNIAIAQNCNWLTADFNCTVTEPAYVNEILDDLCESHPRIYGMILYVEQPFPYEIRENRIDVHSVSARKPLFMDESAHNWKIVRLGRKLGWTGVALKTCKTQTGALLSLCWAKAHGMTLMVQDLTNPMLAQIPHVRLAAHAGTIMGVETNAMQFYPAASAPEEVVHPGLYRRRNGQVDLSTISGAGFGYRLDEIKRDLPEKAASFEK